MRTSSMKIKSVRPIAGIEGGRVTIEGTGFDPEMMPEVIFGGVASRPSLVSRKRIVVDIPEDAKPGPILVSNKQKKSNPYPFVLGEKLLGGLNPVDSPVYDKQGNLYVTFSGKRGEAPPVSVFKITPDGKPDAFLTNIPNATSLAFDSKGFLYISSRFEGTVYRATPDADVTVFAKELGSPTGLAFGRDGFLYAGDRGGRIFKISPDGTSTIFAEIPESMVAFHLAFDPDQNLIVSSPGLSSYDNLLLVDKFGKVMPLHGGFGRPQGIACDKTGNIYLCEAKAGDSKINQISLTGEVSILVTGSIMVGVALDRKGNLAVTTQNAVYYVPLNNSN